MVDRVGRFVCEKNLLGGNDRVLCMVSGGADSVAMLRLLHALSNSRSPEFPNGFQLGICHINYGRRGDASNLDDAFVRALGDELGIPVHSLRAPVEDRSNFQAWARDFRYLAAQNLCRWQGYSRIAVGHNRDDRVETFIYRLISYSGRRSLVVMPPRRSRVIRPILFLTSREVRRYCADSGFAWREDESNESLDYARNQIRQLVVPRLAEIRPDFRERVSDTLSLLEDEDEVLQSVTDDAWQSAFTAHEGQDCLKASELSRMPRATARLVIRRWLSGSGLQIRISRRLLDSIMSLCAVSSGTRSLSLAEDLQVERQYDRLLLIMAGSYGSSAGSLEPVELPVPGKAVFGSYGLEAVAQPSWEMYSTGPDQVIISGDSLNESLTVRAWQPGDRFAPLGFQGNKSIQDLFTDEKVPRGERAGIPIVTDGDAIVWVCGLRVADAFRVTAASERLVGLRVSRRSD
ncbi:MAG: tRNA lysidine(34) synthetase TilS [Thermoleophilia bacterium]|nr:tRNA lysidine(34) synthetase TilS [Thermoleophilia bacterium]